MEETRATLLCRLRDPQDEDAWQQFHELYRDLILRYCQRKGLQHWDAEDIRQIVLLRLSAVLQGGFEYQPEVGRFRAYLGRVVTNSISAFVRRPNPTPREVEEWMQGDRGQPFGQENSSEEDEEWEEEWRFHHLRRAMARLKNGADERNLSIFQQLLDGRSIAEVSAHFEMSQQAVHKVKQRLRNRLRVLIAEQIRAEDGLES